MSLKKIFLNLGLFPRRLQIFTGSKLHQDPPVAIFLMQNLVFIIHLLNAHQMAKFLCSCTRHYTSVLLFETNFLCSSVTNICSFWIHSLVSREGYVVSQTTWMKLVFGFVKLLEYMFNSPISGHLKNVLFFIFISTGNPIEMQCLIYKRDLTDFTTKGCPLDMTREASVKMWMWTRPKWLKIILCQIFPGLPVGAKLITHRLISSLLTMQPKSRYRCCLIVLIEDVLMYLYVCVCALQVTGFGNKDWVQAVFSDDSGKTGLYPWQWSVWGSESAFLCQGGLNIHPHLVNNYISSEKTGSFLNNESWFVLQKILSLSCPVYQNLPPIPAAGVHLICWFPWFILCRYKKTLCESQPSAVSAISASCHIIPIRISVPSLWKTAKHWLPTVHFCFFLLFLIILDLLFSFICLQTLYFNLKISFQSNWYEKPTFF